MARRSSILVSIHSKLQHLRYGIASEVDDTSEEKIQGRGISIKKRLRRLSSVFMPQDIAKPAQVHQDSMLITLGESLQWSWNAWDFKAATKGRPLQVLSMFLFAEAGLMDAFKLNKGRLAAFLERIETGYNEGNAYHNSVHAADVLQRMRSLLMLGKVFPTAVDLLGVLACYLAAIVHDFGHSGFTNGFHVATQSRIAIEYGDRSPQEAHHVATALVLLRCDEYNFLEALPDAQRIIVENSVEEMVMATDYLENSALPERFRAAMLRTGALSDSASSLQGVLAPVAKHGARLLPTGRHPAIGDPSIRSLTLKMAMNVADLAHLTARFEVHKQWVDALGKEFYNQGDIEKALSLPVTRLMDREKPGILQDQVGFFRSVALPLFQHFAAVFPECHPMYQQALSNYLIWSKKYPKAPASEGTEWSSDQDRSDDSSSSEASSSSSDGQRT